jgi:hypothetical protein
VTDASIDAREVRWAARSSGASGNQLLPDVRACRAARADAALALALALAHHPSAALQSSAVARSFVVVCTVVCSHFAGNSPAGFFQFSGCAACEHAADNR